MPTQDTIGKHGFMPENSPRPTGASKISFVWPWKLILAIYLASSRRFLKFPPRAPKMGQNPQILRIKKGSNFDSFWAILRLYDGNSKKASMRPNNFIISTSTPKYTIIGCPFFSCFCYYSKICQIQALYTVTFCQLRP